MPSFIQDSDARFDKKFNHINQMVIGSLVGRICDQDCENDYSLEDIKSHIHAELERYGSRLLDMVEVEAKSGLCDDHISGIIAIGANNAALQRFLSRLSEIRKGIK